MTRVWSSTSSLLLRLFAPERLYVLPKGFEPVAVVDAMPKWARREESKGRKVAMLAAVAVMPSSTVVQIATSAVL